MFFGHQVLYIRDEEWLCKITPSSLRPGSLQPPLIQPPLYATVHLDSYLRTLVANPPTAHPTFANLLSSSLHPILIPDSLPSASWKNGKPALKVPQAMLSSSKESFSFAVIGRFVGKRPSLEWVEEKTKSWAFSRPCMVSLTIKGHFIFRYNSPEDKSHTLSLSPLRMDRRKLLQSRSPGQEESEWPSLAPVWIRLKLRSSVPLLEPEHYPFLGKLYRSTNQA